MLMSSLVSEGDYVLMTLIIHTGVGGCEVMLKEVLGGQSISGLEGNLESDSLTLPSGNKGPERVRLG